MIGPFERIITVPQPPDVSPTRNADTRNGASERSPSD
jgi:hypothetical protein